MLGRPAGPSIRMYLFATDNPCVLPSGSIRLKNSLVNEKDGEDDDFLPRLPACFTATAATAPTARPTAAPKTAALLLTNPGDFSRANGDGGTCVVAAAAVPTSGSASSSKATMLGCSRLLTRHLQESPPKRPIKNLQTISPFPIKNSIFRGFSTLKEQTILLERRKPIFFCFTSLKDAYD